MKFHRSAFPIAFVLALFGCNASGPEDEAATAADDPHASASAVALVKPTGTNTARGVVTFTQEAGGVRVVALLKGVLPAGQHGIHVHMHGDCSGNGDSTHGHWNPAGVAHGLPTAGVHHAGDLGNITSDAAGRATMDQVFPGLELTGANSIVGRGVILHGGTDDGVTQPTGASGPRIGCAEILPAQKKGEAVMNPTTGNTATGKVEFIQIRNRVLVVAHFTGVVPNGKHGFHIHEFGDCSSGDGLSAGGHFNPAGVSHGLPGTNPLHAGDMGNLVANNRGLAIVVRSFDQSSLQGPFSILGRGVIVHALPDDGGQPTGNAGARLSCGEVLPK